MCIYVPMHWMGAWFREKSLLWRPVVGQPLEFPASRKCLWMRQSLVTHMLRIMERVVLPHPDLCINPHLNPFRLSVYQNLSVRHNTVYLKNWETRGNKNSFQDMNLNCHRVLSAKQTAFLVNWSWWFSNCWEVAFQQGKLYVGKVVWAVLPVGGTDGNGPIFWGFVKWSNKHCQPSLTQWMVSGLEANLKPWGKRGILSCPIFGEKVCFWQPASTWR